jgi:transposase
MRRVKRRKITRQFKVAAMSRMEAGENVCSLARELGIKRKLLYDWRNKLRRGGPAALRGPGRPPSIVAMARPVPTAEADRIAELERTIGRQQMALDFFQRALRQVGATPRRIAGRGVSGSTR